MKTLRKKYLIPLTSCLVLGLVGPVFAHPFQDVDKHWAKDQIVWAYEKGIVSGVNANHFSPDATISKGEFYRMVNQYFGFTRKADIHFTDVTQNMWFYDEVRKAVAFGYISDYTGTLQAMSAITRDEAARILAKVYKLPAQTDGVQGFSDKSLIRNTGEVGAIVQKGIMVGKPDKTFDPQGFLTRAEFAVVLKAANDKLGSQYVPSSTTTSQTTPSKDNFGYALNASEYNIFKDKMLTKGYNLDQVQDLWDRGYRNPDKIDQRTGSYRDNWASYNDFCRYYRGLGYTESQIKDLWNSYLTRDSYWYRNFASYNDFYNYYKARNYSNDQILNFWNNGNDPLDFYSKARSYVNYRDFYRFYKDRGYSDTDIDTLWKQGYGWYSNYGYGFRTYNEFYKYFQDKYSEATIKDMWNNGNYRLNPYVDVDGRILFQFK